MRYVATGRIHPERADIHFNRIEWVVEKDGRVSASCEASQLTVILELASIDGFITAYVAAESFAQIVVGALGFTLGSGYSVELIQVTEENGTPHVFGVRPDLEGGGTLGFDPKRRVWERAFEISNHDLFFRLALRDYLRAIRETQDCAMYCYRAIEAIKAAFVTTTGHNRWDDMHKTLGADSTSIEATIKQYADPVRHGNWIEAKPTDRFIRSKMLVLTRDILRAYLDHVAPLK
jgi:hypothetical protein